MVALISWASGRGFLLSVTVLTALFVAGCGGGGFYPVKGTVYLDGEPAKELAGGTVTFTSSELNKDARGQIQADGTYQLGSLKTDDGAPLGEYLVSVSPPETSGTGERGRARPGAKPASFEQPKDLKVTVERKSNDIPIHLNRPRR